MTSASLSDDFRMLPETMQLLSIRTQNCLLRAGYISCDQILAAPSSALMQIRKFGASSMAEVSAWKEAVCREKPDRYKNAHRRLSELLEEVECPCSPVVAAMVMRVLWQQISREPISSFSLQQLLLPAQIEA